MVVPEIEATYTALAQSLQLASFPELAYEGHHVLPTDEPGTPSSHEVLHSIEHNPPATQEAGIGKENSSYMRPGTSSNPLATSQQHPAHRNSPENLIAISKPRISLDPGSLMLEQALDGTSRYREGAQFPLSVTQNRFSLLTRTHIPIRLFFGVCEEVGDGSMRPQPVMGAFPGFPAIIEQIETINELTEFQETHLQLTFSHHRVTVRDIAGYRMAIYTPDSRQWVNIGSFKDDWGLQISIQRVRNHYHTQGSCGISLYCAFCRFPPRLYVYFNFKKFCEAISSKGLQFSTCALSFLDHQNEALSQQLLQHYREGFFLYSMICGQAEMSRRARGLVSNSTPNVQSPSTTFALSQPIVRPQSRFNSQTQSFGVTTPQRQYPPMCIDPSTLEGPFITQASQAPVTLRHGSPIKTPETPLIRHPLGRSRKRRLSDTTAEMRILQTIRGPKGKRIFVPEGRRPLNVKWDLATEKPLGDTKLESDQCLTCLQRPLRCKGTKMIAFKGCIDDMRCENCSKSMNGSGSRKCYWKDAANGILTYDNAKKADPGARYARRNGREAKEERARKRMQEIQAKLEEERQEAVERELQGIAAGFIGAGEEQEVDVLNLDGAVGEQIADLENDWVGEGRSSSGDIDL